MKKIILISLVVMIQACSGSDSTAPQATPLSFFVGTWLSQCLDFGGGLTNKIYTEVSADGTSKLAIVTFGGAPPCSGATTYTDGSGNPIGAPTSSGTIAVETVSGSPTDFYIFNSTPISGPSNYNVVYKTSTTEFFALGNYATPHTTWAGWLTEPEVSAFAAAPTTYVAAGGKIWLHFTTGTLP